MSTFDDDFDAFLDHAGKDFETAPQKKTTTQQTFPCGQCAGTGVYRGHRVHQTATECFACRGKGYFKTDPRKLAERRQKQAQSKRDQLQQKIDAFRGDHPDMFRELAEAHSVGHKSEFIVSLAEQLFQRGFLTENQTGAWYRGKAKLEQIKAEKAAAREANSVAVRIRGVIYPSMSEAARCLGVGYTTIRDARDRGTLNRVRVRKDRAEQKELS